MAELNFSPITPLMMDSFAKPLLRESKIWTPDFLTRKTQPPIVKMTIDTEDPLLRQYKIDCGNGICEAHTYINQVESIKNGITKTVVMLYVVNVDSPTVYNYCDLLVFDNRWGTATLYGLNFHMPYYRAVRLFCYNHGFDLRNGQINDIHRYDRTPIIQGTSLYAAWLLHKLINSPDHKLLPNQFPTSFQLYDFGREFFPHCMPIANTVILTRMLPFYINRHGSKELERFDADIRIPGFYEGARIIPDSDVTWDFSFDGRRHETWRRYRYKVQFWNIKGVRKMLYKAVPTERELDVGQRVPNEEEDGDVICKDIADNIPYKHMQYAFYPTTHHPKEFIPDLEFTEDVHSADPYLRPGNDCDAPHSYPYEQVDLDHHPLEKRRRIHLNQINKRYHYNQLPVHGKRGDELDFEEYIEDIDWDNDLPLFHPVDNPDEQADLNNEDDLDAEIGDDEDDSDSEAGDDSDGEAGDDEAEDGDDEAEDGEAAAEDLIINHPAHDPEEQEDNGDDEAVDAEDPPIIHPVNVPEEHEGIEEEEVYPFPNPVDPYTSDHGYDTWDDLIRDAEEIAEREAGIWLGY